MITYCYYYLLSAAFVFLHLALGNYYILSMLVLVIYQLDKGFKYDQTYSKSP
jgi:hypothetical protein